MPKVIEKSWSGEVGDLGRKEGVKARLQPGDKVILFPCVGGCVTGCIENDPSQATFAGVDQDGMAYFKRGRKLVPLISEERMISYLYILEADVVRLLVKHSDDEKFNLITLIDYAAA